MKIVIDSNVFVSSFFWGGHPREVFERVINGLDELYITDEIIKEITSVMSSGKFNVNNIEIKDYVRIIEKYSKKVLSKNIPKSVSRDKNDDKILQCGLDGNVDYIVTGDKDLLILKEYKTIKIMSPRDYLESVYNVSTL
jgi:putative PIN family toxin of toxin-antitoxin system